MTKIKARSVAFNAEGNMYIVDTEGKLWVKNMQSKGGQNGAWQPIELPDLQIGDPSNHMGY